jgi:hypothetical protein
MTHKPRPTRKTPTECQPGPLRRPAFTPPVSTNTPTYAHFLYISIESDNLHLKNATNRKNTIFFRILDRRPDLQAELPISRRQNVPNERKGGAPVCFVFKR